MNVEKPSMAMPPETSAAPSGGCRPATAIAAMIPPIATSQPLRSPRKAPARKTTSAAATRTISGASRTKVWSEVVMGG
jgi:hypothetical protein